MSPATLAVPADTEITPSDTRSPPSNSVPLPLIEMALPDVPPQPAWLSAAMVGEYSWLLTLPEALPARLGVAPLVRIRANWRGSERVAVMLNWLPRAPRADTTSVRTVPSE